MAGFLRLLAWVVIIAIVVVLLYIRFAPDDAARWHTDPATAEGYAQGGWIVRPEGGNAAFVAADTSPETLLGTFDRIARATPRTQRLAGRPAEGRVTYVTRSRVFGLPDYTTVAAVPHEDGAALILAVRQRYGVADMGVNRARAEDWLAKLRAALPPG